MTYLEIIVTIGLILGLALKSYQLFSKPKKQKSI